MGPHRRPPPDVRGVAPPTATRPEPGTKPKSARNPRRDCAHEQDDAHPPVGSLVADVAKNVGPRTPRLAAPERRVIPHQEPFQRVLLRPFDVRQRRLAAGHPLGDAALEVEHGGARGQEGLLRRLDRREDPGDLLEDRLRRIRRPRGVLGLGPRLPRVGQAGQAFLELRGSLREPTERSGQRALPLPPEFLRSLEPLERRLPPHNAQRPLELQLETSAFLGKLALDGRDLAARDPQRLDRAQECLHLRGARRHLRQRDGRRRRGRRCLRN